MRISPAVVYTTGHFLNEKMSLTLSMGFRARRRSACARVTEDGNVRYIPVTPQEGTCAIAYGILRGTGEILKSCETRGLDYLYCDHSYFGQTRAGNGSSDYYRVVPNGRYYTHLGDCPKDRFQALNIRVEKWRWSGNQIVLVPVSKFVAAYHGIDANDWLTERRKEIRRYTDRPIVVKPKDSDVPLDVVLRDAWALVTEDSNAAVDAVIAGIPVFTSPNAAAAPFGSSDLSKLEKPSMGSREQHLANLAYQQWTCEEIRSGRAAATLQERIDQWGSKGTGGVPPSPGVTIRNSDRSPSTPTLQGAG